MKPKSKHNISEKKGDIRIALYISNDFFFYLMYCVTDDYKGISKHSVMYNHKIKINMLPMTHVIITDFSL